MDGGFPEVRDSATRVLCVHYRARRAGPAGTVLRGPVGHWQCGKCDMWRCMWTRSGPSSDVGAQVAFVCSVLQSFAHMTHRFVTGVSRQCVQDAEDGGRPWRSFWRGCQDRGGSLPVPVLSRR